MSKLRINTKKARALKFMKISKHSPVEERTTRRAYSKFVYKLISADNLKKAKLELHDTSSKTYCKK